MERFLKLFGRFVDFAYAIWDRIVLRGYYEALQRPENIVYFFREVSGVRCITPAVLARRTGEYRKWVEGRPSEMSTTTAIQTSSLLITTAPRVSSSTMSAIRSIGWDSGWWEKR